MSVIDIEEGVSISGDELEFTASRSSGPGGQNVNKVDSRVTLWFDVRNSGSLTAEQKQRILARLATRVNREGVLRVVSQKTRSQAANRNAALERFVDLLHDALRRSPLRKKTRASKAAKQRRLDEKKHRANVKRERLKKIESED